MKASPRLTIYFVIDVLDNHGGATQLLLTLATMMRNAGYGVHVFSALPILADNQYAHALRAADIPLDCVQTDLGTGELWLAPLFPLRLLLTMLIMLARGISFRHAWSRITWRFASRMPERLRRGQPPYVFYLNAVWARLRGRRVLVHAHRGSEGVLWGKRMRLPTLFLENSAPTRGLGIDWWWADMHETIARADCTVVGSARAAEAVRHYYAYHGALAILPWASEMPLRTLSNGGAPKRIFTLGVAARLDPEKGHEWLIYALPRILAQHPVRVRFAGEGVFGEWLRTLAKELKVQNSLEFLGKLPHSEMTAFYDSLDALIVPSVLEGQPLVLLEAMARGVPIIATDVGGVCELLEHGRVGLVVPPREPQPLADAILELMNDPERRAAFGHAGQAHWLNHHSPQAVLPLWRALYAQLAARYRTQPWSVPTNTTPEDNVS